MRCQRAILCVVVLAACSSADARETLVTRDTLPGGIARVMSRGPVDSGAFALVLDRDIQPAEGEPGELMAPSDLALADDGTLYVVDDKPRLIKVFGPDGVYRNSIGRQGAGPGEFGAAWIAVRGDTLALQDPSQTRGTVFNGQDGSVLSIRPTACCYWYPIAIDGGGRAVARMMTPPDSTLGPRQAFIRFALDGSGVDTAFVPERPTPSNLKQWNVSNGDRMMFSRQVPLRPRGVHAVDPTGGFVTGWSDQYLLVASQNGSDTGMVFGRNFTPEPVTSAEKNAIVDAIIAETDFEQMETTEAVLRSAFDPSAIPDQRPAFAGIWVDLAGRRWVQLSSADTSKVTFDLFDRDGTWLDQLSLGGDQWPSEAWKPVSFARDRVAVLLETEDGLPLVRVFRIERRAP